MAEHRAREPEGAEPQSFGARFDPKRNSFGFIRFAAALLVVFSHSYSIGNFGTEPLSRVSGGQADFGSLAVAIFFIVSGFLIARSFLTTRGTGRYLWRRALRILPGYWACLLVTAFGFGLGAWLLDHGSVSGFLSSHPSPWEYVHNNLFVAINRWDAAGAFATNPHHGINGSLWTLIYEVRAYLLLAVLGTLGLLRRRPIVVIGLVTFMWVLFVTHRTLAASFALPFYDPFFLRFTIFFLLGAITYILRDHIPFDGRLAVCCAIALVAGSLTHTYRTIEFIPLTYLCLWAAIALPFVKFNVRTDLSYGMYIYAWPIQQSLTRLGVNRATLVPYFAAAVCATLGMAWASWRFVERPALQFKDLRRRSSGVPGPVAALDRTVAA